MSEHIPQRFIGLMSGTSLDGIDIVCAQFSSGSEPCFIEASNTYPFSATIQEKIKRLMAPGNNEIWLAGQLDRELGEVFADAINQFLTEFNISADSVTAIGSHGQTIRHHPEAEKSFTLQIGDPNTIAMQTGIDVIADFRRKDIALGGEGAPLVPAFHRDIFSAETDRVIVNIGGFANLTTLPGRNESATIQQVTGFDTGPGNTLLDQWFTAHNHRTSTDMFDRDGAWSEQGTLLPELLKAFMADPYFSRPAPKSTGREYFNLSWLAQFDVERYAPVDVQTTLTHLTARSIIEAIVPLSDNAELLLCGGGSHNKHLVRLIGEYYRQLTQNPILQAGNVGNDGMSPDDVEAAAFAWLAKQFLANKPGNVPAVTGASAEAVLGSLTKAN